MKRALALLGLAVLAAAAAAQETRAPLVVGVDVSLVSLPVVVQDKNGQFVTGLTAADIEVREDGVLQTIQFLREAKGEGRLPLSVVLVLDSSGSMRSNVHLLREAATSFVGKLGDGDEILVIDFGEAIRSAAAFTADLDQLERTINGIQPWGRTKLYDAIHHGLTKVRDRPGRKALVVFSDGADTLSDTSEDDVIEYARAVEAAVYCIGIRGADGLRDRGPRGFLRKLAQETGGSFFFPERAGELVRIFSTVSDELRNHYALGYAPIRPPDNTFRKLEVRVKRKDVTVRTRKGYRAVIRRRPS